MSGGFCMDFPLASGQEGEYDGIMEVKNRDKRGLAAIFRLCPVRHVLLLVSAGLILLHLLTRGNYAFNRALSENVVRPLHRTLAQFNAHVPFSVAELLIALAVMALLGYLIYQVAALIRRDGRGARLYRTLVTLLTVPLTIYALFCLLWGVFYYGDDFIAKSGLRQEPISVEQLEAVTAYFAQLANEYGEQVSRDDNGVYTADRQQLLADSPAVYGHLEEEFPCLSGPELAAKGILCSRVMSAVDFTGFFFPFTAEANVNMDFPPSLLASTIAHELAHQRGVAKEQEANFVAVLASLESEDSEYSYSACLLAFVHLANALATVKPEAVRMIYAGLDAGVLADLQAGNDYWARFESPVQTVTDAVYEGFLQSYDQKLGMRSYGACVDLLVNYYRPAAAAYFHAETA